MKTKEITLKVQKDLVEEFGNFVKEEPEKHLIRYMKETLRKEKQQQLRLYQRNIHSRVCPTSPLPLCPLNQQDRMGALVREIKDTDADILILQEIEFSETVENYLIKPLKKLGYNFYFPYATDEEKERERSAKLWCLSILAVKGKVHFIPKAIESSELATNLRAVRGQIVFKDKEFELLGIHVPGKNKENDVRQEERYNNAMNYIENVVRQNVSKNMMLCGDLNTIPSQNGLLTMLNSSGSLEHATSDFGTCIDYAMANKKFFTETYMRTVMLEDVLHLSDHRALLTEIRFQKPGGDRAVKNRTLDFMKEVERFFEKFSKEDLYIQFGDFQKGYIMVKPEYADQVEQFLEEHDICLARFSEGEKPWDKVLGSVNPEGYEQFAYLQVYDYKSYGKYMTRYLMKNKSYTYTQQKKLEQRLERNRIDSEEDFLCYFRNGYIPAYDMEIEKDSSLEAEEIFFYIAVLNGYVVVEKGDISVRQKEVEEFLKTENLL